jgi:tetratricopeptide (TPR) repeat protein
VTFVLVAAVAGAQSLPVPPRPPTAPKAPAFPAAPPIAPDLEMRLEGLGTGLENLEGLRDLTSSAVAMALGTWNLADLQDAVIAKGQAFTLSSENMEYDRGTSYLDSGRYDRAVEAFDKVIAKGGKKADGATYWKAYALNRLGKRDESIRTIEELEKKYPSSRWANDAKALLIDVRQASGQPMSPDKAGDEELKLIALNALMMRDPDRAIPMVEQLLTGSASPKLKERGLFVLAQSAAARARTLLGEVAKGKGNPDLQLKALDYLGVFGNGPDVPLLVDVYKSTGDIDVKRRVIRSLAMTGRRGAGFNFSFGDFPVIYGQAMDEARAELDRARAEIERTRAQAGVERERVRVSTTRSAASAEREKAREAKAKEAGDALWQLYQAEPSLELEREILRNLRFSAQSERLLQIAKSDGNPALRFSAIQGLMLDRSPKTAETMLGLYREEKDLAVRRQIIDSFPTQGSAATLVQMARQEADLPLRKRIVERLSTMKEKEAVDYMMEILKK